MAHLFDYNQNTWVDVPDQQVGEALSSGNYQFPQGRLVRVLNPDGETSLIKSEDATTALRGGYQYLSDSDYDRVKEQKRQEKLQMASGGIAGQTAAGLAGALRTATFGLSDPLIAGAAGTMLPGGTDQAKEIMRGFEEANPITSTVGEVAGLLTPGGAGARIAGASLKAGGRVAGAATAPMARLAQQFGSGIVGRGAQGLVRATESAVRLGTAGAIEGAAEGVRQSLTDYALDKDQASIENTIAQVKLGTLLGGGFGFGLGGMGKISQQLGKAGLEWNRVKGPGKKLNTWIRETYPKVFTSLRGITGEDKAAVMRAFQDEKLAQRMFMLQDSPDQTIDAIADGFRRTQDGANELAGAIGTQRKAVVETFDSGGARPSLFRKKWKRLAKDYRGTLDEIAKAPDVKGGQQGRIIAQTLALIDEASKVAQSPANLHKRVRDVLTDLNQSYTELRESKAKSGVLEAFRAEVNDLTTDPKIWGKGANEYRNINRIYRKYYTAYRYLFGGNNKGGALTTFDKLTGKIDIDDTKVNSLFRSAAQPKGKQVIKAANMLEEATEGMESYLKANPNAVVDIEGIQGLISNSKQLVEDMFFAKANNVLFNRQQTWTGKIMQEQLLPTMLGGAAGSALGPLGATAGAAVAGAIPLALSNPRVMMRYSHGLMFADEGLTKNAYRAVRSFLSSKPVAERSMALGAYSLGRAAKALGVDRKRGETDTAYLTRAVRQFAQQPQETELAMRSSLWGMSPNMPEHYYRIANIAQRAIDFVNSKLPPTSDNPFNALETEEPSYSERQQLEAYVDGAFNPSSLLTQLQNQSLKIETVEAVQSVYPEFYEEVRGLISDELVQKKPKLNYYQQLELGILFQLPTTPGLASMGAVQEALQSSAVQAEGEKSPSRTPSKSRVAQATLSGSAGLMARRAT